MTNNLLTPGTRTINAQDWFELLLANPHPGTELRKLNERMLLRIAPELHGLIGKQQDPKWHPEGDAFVHTCHCLNAFADHRWHWSTDYDQNALIGLAVLCHDLGKATHTQCVAGEWKSTGHEEAGEEPTRRLLGRLGILPDQINLIVSLVVNHMVPKDLFRLHQLGRNTDRAIRRLAERVPLKLLARVCHADSCGRPPAPAESPDAEWLWQMAERPSPPATPKPMLLGRHLIELGVKPGPTMGVILDAALDAQLAGEITNMDQALAFARAHIP